MELKYNGGQLTIDNNCAILGANGTGKSSLSRNILQLNNGTRNIQFISAQRDLTFLQGSLKGSQDDSLEKNIFSFNNRKNGKLGFANLGFFYEKDFYNNTIQDDFNENLEKLFREDINLHSDASRNHVDGKEFKRPITKADKVFGIWNNIFLDRKIKIVKGKIRVIYKDYEYDIENLSDGERSALYLITKCLYAPDNGIIIVDEGESHLNPALLYELWDSIEKERNDCRFIYISHDINFITSRCNCQKLWIKNFVYPEQWEIESIQNDEFPEDLILQIIGTKKEKILFVESEKGGDEVLYQKIYTDFKIIPIGSCLDVINFTKSLNKISQNYNKKYFGLIDRDFRNKENLESLEKNKVFYLPVAEFENLFFRKEVVEFIFNHLGNQNFENKFLDMEKEIFNLKMDEQFKKDFFKNFVIQKFNEDLERFKANDNFSYTCNNINDEWDNWINKNDLNSFLEILNAKGALKGKVINKLDLGNWKKYYEQVINIFNTDNSEDFRKIFLSFMPSII